MVEEAMMARCWCGLELVDGYIKDAERDHPGKGCPDHGEDYVWRPCDFVERTFLLEQGCGERGEALVY